MNHNFSSSSGSIIFQHLRHGADYWVTLGILSHYFMQKNVKYSTYTIPLMYQTHGVRYSCCRTSSYFFLNCVLYSTIIDWLTLVCLFLFQDVRLVIYSLYFICFKICNWLSIVYISWFQDTRLVITTLVCAWRQCLTMVILNWPQ